MPKGTNSTATKTPTAKTGRAVVVTTKDKGVFFGYVKDESQAPEQITLTKMRNCIYWPTQTKGFMGLASDGPHRDAKVGPPADIELRKVTAVVEVTPSAEKVWNEFKW